MPRGLVIASRQPGRTFSCPDLITANLARQLEQLICIFLQTQLANIAEQRYQLCKKPPTVTAVNNPVIVGQSQRQ